MKIYHIFITLLLLVSACKKTEDAKDTEMYLYATKRPDPGAIHVYIDNVKVGDINKVWDKRYAPVCDDTASIHSTTVLKLNLKSGWYKLKAETDLNVILPSTDFYVRPPGNCESRNLYYYTK